MDSRYFWRVFRRMLALALLVVVATACQRGSGSGTEPPGLAPVAENPPVLKPSDGEAEVNPSVEPSYDRIRWIQRVARSLRGGRSLTDINLVHQLARKTDAEVIEHLMDQPEFADTALDFNLHFLGFRRDHIRDADGELSDTVFDFPSALTSALEVLKNGNYLRLLEYKQPLYHGRLRNPVPLDTGDDKIPVEDLRAKHFKRIRDGLTQQIEFLRANPATPVANACVNFMKDLREGYQLGDTGILFSLMDIGFFTNIWYGRLVEACSGPFRDPNLDFAAGLERIRKINDDLIQALKAFEPAVYSTRNLADVRILDVAKLDLAPGWHFFGVPHRQSLMNSSTNFNRKRAAYVLSRFFCDDLTPINVEAPSQHTGGGHASDPACVACHYKLDPMAGFFRGYGYLFSDYKSSDKIRFDDNASTETDEYNKAWLAPAGSARKWNIGFIRSSTRESLNAYGSEMEDLFRIIQTEPEAKRCLVKRMFEYFVSDQQAMDGGYHSYLSEMFIRLAKANSTKAFKEVAKTILLSRSYNEADPVSDQCYDYAPGYDPNGRPPCKVAHILEKNCASCHGSTIEEPYLDLSSWIKTASGGYSFPHLDENMDQIDTKTTFERIVDRLSTMDPKRRMPLRKHMDALDREALFKWANEVLDAGGSKLRMSFFKATKTTKKAENKCLVVR